MNDKETEWISYYCWEKNFGRNSKLKVTDKDGKEISLVSSEDLWNILVKIE